MTGAEGRARELIAATELFDELGYGRLAASARTVAHDCIEALDWLDAERSARVALQRRCDELQAIVGKAAYRACVKAAA